MKRFLLRLGLILGPFLALLGILVHVAYHMEMDALRRDLTCSTNIVAAVVGDSRVEEFFDCEEIPWLANFGLGATPFEVSAHKARLIVDCNPHLQLLVIDVWPGSFFARVDRPYDPCVPRHKGIALIEMMTRDDMPPLGGGGFHCKGC